MRVSKRRFLFAAAAVAAAALVAGSVPAVATEQISHRGRTPTNLESVLLPPSEHPAGTTVFSTVSLKQASAQVLPGTGEPSGVVVMPRCMSYFAVLGGLNRLKGGHQFGVRSAGTQFVHIVAKAPRDGLELIRHRIAACNEGLMTFQGWPPSATGGGKIVDGVLSFTERPAQSVPGADTYAATQTVTFNQPDDPLTQQIRAAWQCSDRPCTSPIAFLQRGDLFIWVLDDHADEMALKLYERARRR